MQLPEKPDPTVQIPQFDVISVKPSKDNQTRVQFTPDGVRGAEVTTQFLLLGGFGLIYQDQVLGAPSWSTSEGFDIEAKVAAADIPTMAKLTLEQRSSMLQQILADRFHLVAHHETRELPIYRLTLARNGSRLKQLPPDDPASATPRRRGVIFGPGKVTVIGESIAALIKPLSRQLGRMVIDNTGLTGSYNFTLEWTPEGGAPPAAGGSPSGNAPQEDSAPDIFTAIREQLGLKLESSKGPVDVIIIDHIERPSAN